MNNDFEKYELHKTLTKAAIDGGMYYEKLAWYFNVGFHNSPPAGLYCIIDWCLLTNAPTDVTVLTGEPDFEDHQSLVKQNCFRWDYLINSNEAGPNGTTLDSVSLAKLIEQLYVDKYGNEYPDWDNMSFSEFIKSL